MSTEQYLKFRKIIRERGKGCPKCKSKLRYINGSKKDTGYKMYACCKCMKIFTDTGGIPSRKKMLYIQHAGRCLRTDPKKTKTIILDKSGGNTNPDY